MPHDASGPAPGTVPDLASGAFPEPEHDHDRCRDDLLDLAESLCAAEGARLTPQRRRVLEVVADGHAAVGAYEIADRLGEAGAKPAPMAVYRALEFLMDKGLVHRLNSLNAFVACAQPGCRHGAQFLICERCRRVAEFADGAVDAAIASAAAEAGFGVTAPHVEVLGTCPHCREAA